MDWNRKELFELVKKSHGIQQADLMKPALVAVNAKTAIVDYHVEEFKKIISIIFTESETDNYIQAVRLIFEQASGTDAGFDFALAQFKAEANLIAFAQALHSLADIFGQIIFNALDLNNILKKKLQKNLLYLQRVADAIKNHDHLKDLSLSVADLLESKQYSYLKAYVNTTKHRCLISANYSVDFKVEIEPIHGMKIPKFNYNCSEYPSKWSDDFVNNDRKFLISKFVEIGIQLNEILKKS